MTINFKFEMDQKVKTPFEDGIIEMLGYDDGGVKYYVTTKSNGAWYKEKELNAI